MSEFTLAVLKIVLALPVVLVLAYLSVRYGLAYKKGFQGANRELKLVDQLFLAPKSRICVIKVGKKYLVVGVGEKEITYLAELQDYPEGEVAPGVRGYATWLEGLLGGRTSLFRKEGRDRG